MNNFDFIPEELPTDHRSGFVAVIGRPNVGKSTLINAWLGQKIAIVSPKPQTTRNRLLGILTRPDAQVIFVDTPGIHRPHHKLGEFMVETAVRAIPDADVILWLVDVSVEPTPEDQQIAELLAEKAAGRPVILALNKADLLQPQDVVSHSEAYLAMVEESAWLLISATRGDNRDDLLEKVIAHLPPGPPYYPPDQVTDQQERFIAAELVREQVLHHTHQEVPHAVAVVVQEFKRRSEDMTYISANIYVERESQKKILLGAGGQVIKRIGQAARQEIEQLVGTRVYLDLWVKVRPQWRKKEPELRRLGYALPQRK
ncbi:MAG: GTPase Era [Anaerolineae bacterium]|nr:GTPase Era [Anaerolineae bacterium]